MGGRANALLIVGSDGVTVALLIKFQRHLSKPGGRKGGGTAAGMGLVESLLAPSSYEARIDVERQGQLQAPVPSQTTRRTASMWPCMTMAFPIEWSSTPTFLDAKIQLSTRTLNGG